MAKVGRPRKFDNPEEMQIAIATYFKLCEEKEVPVTITGLALALDMTTETLRTYGEDDEFSATVKKAKMQVEQYLEMMLYSGRNATGPIFSLKNNFGWKDTQTTEHEHGGKIQVETTVKMV